MTSRLQVDVLVVGTINEDHIYTVDRLPQPGESVIVNGFQKRPGGKGANQAVAAARQGARVAMLGAVGEDTSGTTQLAALTDEQVDTSLVRRRQDLVTGRAVITVSRDAENYILVATGANTAIPLELLSSSVLAKAVLTQTEARVEPVREAARYAAARRARFILNHSPVLDLPDHILAQADPLIVNAVEAHQIHANLPADPAAAAMELREHLSCPSTVITLGKNGVAYSDGGDARHVPIPREVKAIDTTGAGDAFAGTMAAALSRGATLNAGVSLAQEASARTVQRLGARLR